MFIKNVTNIENIKLKAELLNTTIRKTYFGENTKYTISTSIGIAYYPSHGKSFSDLYKMADTALYESKFNGLQCTICNDGKMLGFIGFDDCSKKRVWHGDEVATLAYISRILSVFMVKSNTSLELLESYKNHMEMLDNLNGYVYVINPSTYELLYLNKPMIDLGAKVSENCHQVAFSSDIPCENCPVKKLTAEKP